MVIYSAPRCCILKVLIAVCELQLFILIANGQQPELWWHSCPNTTTYSQNSTYQANLRRVLSDLSSNDATTNLFFNATVGINAPDVVYGLVLCRGDITSDACRECVKIATAEIITKCPIEKESYIWYDQCMLRYNNISFFGNMDTYPGIYVFITQNVSNPDRFDQVLGDVMDVLINRASGTESFGPVKGFATGVANITSILKLFNLVQCTPNLSSLQCNQCLSTAFGHRTVGSPSWRVIYPSCNIRYETYLFYNSNVAFPAPPPSPTPSFLLPPPPSQVPDIDSEGNRGLSVVVILVVAIVFSMIVFIALLGVAFCLLIRKAEKIQNVMISTTDGVEGNDISATESLQYDLTNIKAATNNFSAENKIGEGGFGQVFKGTLNGHQIAVKRLSKNSEQGQQEFKNEVLLVAKLEHKNLVRVLGYCLDEGEKILIYEFVPNKSLDFILFDQEKRQSLDWPRRYKIIGGVAKGILYLHEDSRLRIIHRDLKASNVLLDIDMNAKIADFGLSRIVGLDESKVNSRRIVGTFGYMPPEYIHGQFSMKSDVFSFGVLVLEIISGKKNNGFYQSSDHLLSHAWKLWRDRRPIDFADPSLGDTLSRNEVIQCIHIGLLCVQKDPNERPSMGSVVLMLSSYSVTLPSPHHPAFFLGSRTKTKKNPSPSYKSTSKSLPLSVNEVSMTELYPR